METISNVAAAASKAIFGEQKTAQNETGGQEPISGAQGQGTTNEPFDKGNAEDPITGTTAQHAETGIRGDNSKDRTASSIVSETVIPPLVPADRDESTSTGEYSAPHYASNTPETGESTLQNTKTESGVATGRTGAGMYTANDSGDTGVRTSRSGAGIYTAHSNDRAEASGNTPGTTATGAMPSAIPSGMPDPHKNTDKTGVPDRTLDPPKAHDVVPTERAPGASNPGAGPAGTGVKHQGADAPTDAPTGEQRSAVKSQKEEAEELLKKRDPNDHSGEPMHMHDGPEKPPTTQEERRTSKAGNPGGQEHGKDPKGTGEEWVKTSGMAVDGGDFDATKPGAGREADRLMEEKGIKKTTSGSTGAAPEEQTASTAQSGSEKEKVSLGDKLKNKLHIGHKNK